MTDTTINIAPALDPDTRLHPSGILANAIIALLAPMFLTVTAGDISLARMAAIETVNAYGARNHADLLAVAQIIAFGLAALGSLCLSLAGDISPSMALRLRGSANACNRSAEQNRRALTSRRADDPNPHHHSPPVEPELPATTPDDPAPPEPDRLLSPAAEQELAAEADARLQPPAPTLAQAPTPPATAEKRHQEMWAITMVKEASEITAGIANLPPAERGAASIRAAALSSTAYGLLHGTAPEPPLDIGALVGTTRPGRNGRQLQPSQNRSADGPRPAGEPWSTLFDSDSRA
jgi:hypothetical protein